MPDSLLTVDGLQKFFKIKRGFPNPVTMTVRAVDNVSFHLKLGEAFGLVGESGCGKTTVGRCILRLVEPDKGRVQLRGEDVANADRARLRLLRRRMQIIFQDPYSSLNPRRTVGQTFSEPIKVHKIAPRSEIRERVVALLQEVGLSAESMDKFPHEFSGGQRQRIGVARALAVEPSLIVCDEAVAAQVASEESIQQLRAELVSQHSAQSALQQQYGHLQTELRLEQEKHRETQQCQQRDEIRRAQRPPLCRPPHRAQHSAAPDCSLAGTGASAAACDFG